MYIFPSTELWVLRNIPLDPSYENTIYFFDEFQQLGYFTRGDFTICHFYNLSYVRPTDQYVQIEWPVDQLYGANYLCFRNNAFGNEMLYAFVTNVEYVNNKTARLYYQLDYLQSWFFEHNVGQCFVEREHTATDNPGDNIIPENLEIGEYLLDEWSAPPYFEKWVFGVLTTKDASGTAISGGVYQGIYSGAQWKIFDEPSDLNNWLEQMTNEQAESAIINVMMFPLFSNQNPNSSAISTINLNVPTVYYPNGYTPRNKKLCTYPFTSLMVTDYQGHAAEYKYEWFNTKNPANVSFKMYSALSAVPQFMLNPLDYKGMKENVNEGFIIGEIPQCCYAIDGYRAWLAMASNRVGVGTDLATGAFNVGAGLVNVVANAENPLAGMGMSGSTAIAPLSDATSPRAGNVMPSGGIIGGMAQVTQGAFQIANTLAKVSDARKIPPQAKSTPGGSAIFQTGKYGYHFIRTYISPEFAHCIDDYFDLYGYAVHRVKYPNVRNHPSAMRPSWNYIKTIGCKIEGTVPAEVEKILCAIYDNGIRFWSFPGDVGNYTQNNAPRS